MSLVFDALKQHREPATAPLSAPLGSVLPDTERPVHSHIAANKNPLWLTGVLLAALAAGFALHQYSGPANPASGNQKDAMQQPAPQAPVAAAPVAAAPVVTAPVAAAPVAVAPVAAAPVVTAPVVAAPVVAAPAPVVAAPVSTQATKDDVHLQAQTSSSPQPKTVKAATRTPAPKEKATRTVVALATNPVHEKTVAASASAPAKVDAPAKVSPAGKADAADRPVAAAAPAATDKAAPAKPGSGPIVHVAMAQDAAPSSPPPAARIITGPLTDTASKPAQPVARHVMAPQEVDLIVTRFNDAVRAGEFDSAKTLLGKVTDGLGDDSLVVLRMHGYLALKMGNLRQAREDYQRVVANLQNDYEANRNLAVIELREGNPDLSKKRSKHMLEIYPDDPVFKVLAN